MRPREHAEPVRTDGAEALMSPSAFRGGDATGDEFVWMVPLELSPRPHRLTGLPGPMGASRCGYPSRSGRLGELG